jgi:hypothetical protein
MPAAMAAARDGSDQRRGLFAAGVQGPSLDVRTNASDLARDVLESNIPSFEASISRSRPSGQLHRAVVVAMIAMRMMQPSAHEVIDVITMGHGCVSAGCPMLVRAARLRRALHGIGGVDRDGVFVDMIFVRVMEVAVVEIIDVAFMADRRMPAVGTMLVGVVGMMLLGTGGHDVFILLGLRSEGDRRLSPFGGILHGALHQTQNVSVGE